ncbi:MULTISPECIES: DUF6904 family protein [Klebsiella/Raoultella group]|nr:MULTISPECIES: hypothetical protein [Enterobacteriaceae]MDH7613002.1 hypothetical protein [Raoultella ornithinolytica]MDY7626436.1 hypothetical protein [Raoultella planticola]VEC75574.1 Uncharacterised protein [Raoultella ornithinolytica]
MLRYELTPNNAGFVLWGDSEALDELHQLIHFLVDESPLIEGKDGFMLSLAYDIRKAREGCRRTEQYEYESQDTYHIYGVELLWPLILIQLALFRRSMSYIQVNKNHLLLMYSFEHILESALKELMPECWEDLIRIAKCAADSDFKSLEDNIDSRCCYFINLQPKIRKNQLRNILCSFDSLWGKYALDKQDVKMLNEMNSTTGIGQKILLGKSERGVRAPL